MAREWLLRGVDPEELKATPKDEGPQTPQSRWENFWYHHKLKFWLILFAVVVLIILVVQLINRDPPDYRVLLLSEKTYSVQELEALSTLLEQYGEDIDGDGKVEIQVENCIYGAHVEQSRNSGIQQVQAHLVAGDRMFFMFEPDAYQYFTKTLPNIAGGEVDFFATIEADVSGLMEEDTIWNWKGDARPVPELQERAPKLYFGIRDAVGNASKMSQLHEQSMTLLENFITDSKTVKE